MALAVEIGQGRQRVGNRFHAVEPDQVVFADPRQLEHPLLWPVTQSGQQGSGQIEEIILRPPALRDHRLRRIKDIGIVVGRRDPVKAVHDMMKILVCLDTFDDLAAVERQRRTRRLVAHQVFIGQRNLRNLIR